MAGEPRAFQPYLDATKQYFSQAGMELMATILVLTQAQNDGALQTAARENVERIVNEMVQLYGERFSRGMFVQKDIHVATQFGSNGEAEYRTACRWAVASLTRLKQLLTDFFWATAQMPKPPVQDATASPPLVLKQQLVNPVEYFTAFSQVLDGWTRELSLEGVRASGVDQKKCRELERTEARFRDKFNRGHGQDQGPS